MTPAKAALLALVAGLLAYDSLTLRRHARPGLVVQAIVFAAGAALIISPDTATRLAHAVGIGRGVDFVLYPLVIWLVRESLAHRRLRLDADARVAELARAAAIAGARGALARGVPFAAARGERED